MTPSTPPPPSTHPGKFWLFLKVILLGMEHPVITNTFILSRRISPKVSLKLACLTWTPINTDNHSLTDPTVLLSYKVNLALSAHCIQMYQGDLIGKANSFLKVWVGLLFSPSKFKNWPVLKCWFRQMRARIRGGRGREENALYPPPPTRVSLRAKLKSVQTPKS